MPPMCSFIRSTSKVCAKVGRPYQNHDALLTFLMVFDYGIITSFSWVVLIQMSTLVHHTSLSLSHTHTHTYLQFFSYLSNLQFAEHSSAGGLN